MMKVYAVRQKSTGLFIPKLEVGKCRGGSHLEPSNDRTPRLFHSHRAAQAFLGNWLQGKFQVGYSNNPEYEPDIEVIKQPHRKKEDMEIVEFSCFEVPVGTLKRDPPVSETIVAARYAEMIATEEPNLLFEETQQGEFNMTYKISKSDRAVIQKALDLFSRSKMEFLTFQERVWPWMMACFSMEICRGTQIGGVMGTQERCHRFIEEALELVQACGTTSYEVRQLVEYVYGRKVGDKVQEIGGVMVTLAALCLAEDLNMHEAGEIELKRIWEKIDEIRAKQAAKPKHSPLPA